MAETLLNTNVPEYVVHSGVNLQALQGETIPFLASVNISNNMYCEINEIVEIMWK